MVMTDTNLYSREWKNKQKARFNSVLFVCHILAYICILIYSSVFSSSFLSSETSVAATVVGFSFVTVTASSCILQLPWKTAVSEILRLFVLISPINLPRAINSIFSVAFTFPFTTPLILTSAAVMLPFTTPSLDGLLAIAPTKATKEAVAQIYTNSL